MSKLIIASESYAPAFTIYHVTSEWEGRKLSENLPFENLHKGFIYAFVACVYSVQETYCACTCILHSWSRTEPEKTSIKWLTMQILLTDFTPQPLHNLPARVQDSERNKSQPMIQIAVHCSTQRTASHSSPESLMESTIQKQRHIQPSLGSSVKGENPMLRRKFITRFA